MTGVILIAGKGRRLGTDQPKCLLDIGGKTILERQLSALKTLNVARLVCVIGYQKDKVRQAVESLWDGDVNFVENMKYETTNTVYSLYLAIKHVSDDFVFMNGDVVFRPDLLKYLVEPKVDGILAIVCKNCGDEEVKVIVNNMGIIKIGKKLPPDKCLGEFIGVALFRKSMLDSFVESLTCLVEEKQMINEYFEAGLAEIADKVRLLAVDITKIPCIEIDFPEDLEWARRNHIEFEKSENNRF